QRGAFHLATSGRQPHFSSVLRSEDAVRVPRRTPDALRSALEATGPWNELAVEQLDVAAAMASDMFVVGRDQEAGPGVTVDPVEQRHDLVGGFAVEVSGRLVGTHQRGCVQQRA